eukprot:3065704-Amphidinium_carterae.2
MPTGIPASTHPRLSTCTCMSSAVQWTQIGHILYIILHVSDSSIKMILDKHALMDKLFFKSGLQAVLHRVVHKQLALAPVQLDDSVKVLTMNLQQEDIAIMAVFRSPGCTGVEGAEINKILASQLSVAANEGSSVEDAGVPSVDFAGFWGG